MRRRARFLASFAVATLAFTAHALGGQIRFMEGSDGTKAPAGECTDAPGQKISFKKTPGFKNGVARSMILTDVRKGAVIKVFNDGGGNPDEGWTEVRVLKDVKRYTVGSFDKTYEDEAVRVTFRGADGIDGKVSRVEVD